MHKGAIETFFVPLYKNPIVFESHSSFSLIFTGIPEQSIAESERRFYYPANPPYGFQKISSGIYSSTFISGISYPSSFLQKIDSLFDQHLKTIFVAGGKGSGKSTLFHLLINKCIFQYGSCVVFDLDPGQTEISLPGSLSLSVLKRPIFSPPEHCSSILSSPCESCYRVVFGSCLIADNINLYIKCVEKLKKILIFNNYKQDHLILIMDLDGFKILDMKFINNFFLYLNQI